MTADNEMGQAPSTASSRPAAELATRFVGSAHPLLDATFCAERALATPTQPQDLLWLRCDDARAEVIASDWARAYRLAVTGQAPASDSPPPPPPSTPAGNRERTAQFWRTRLTALDQLELPHDLSAAPPGHARSSGE